MEGSLLTTVAFALNSFENPYLFAGLVSLGALAVGWIRKNYSFAFFIAVGLSFASAHIIKSIFQIPRPDTALVEVVGYRFPSMHAVIASAVLISITYYTIAHTQNIYAKYLCGFIALFLISIVGYTRIMLNVHDPIDVIVGTLLGTGISLVVHTITIRYTNA